MTKQVDILTAQVEELECMLEILESRLSTHKPKKIGRKEQVLAMLQEHGPISAEKMSVMLSKETGDKITPRNISSQLSYLRKDKIAIATNSKGFKFIES